MNKKLKQQARDIVRQAIDQYDPSSIWLAFSGGYDSAVMTHLLYPLLEQLPYVPKEMYREEVKNRYYQLIDHFYQRVENAKVRPSRKPNLLSLVITSNLRPNQLAEFFGGATWTRLYQMTDNGRYIADLTGVPNYRMLK